MQERQRGPRASHTGRRFLVMRTSLSASVCTMKDLTIGESISEFEVSKGLCADHSCLSVILRRWVGVVVMCGDKGYLCHKNSSVEISRKIPRLHSCVQKKTTCTTST